MEMIDIFKSQLEEGMEIKKVKELASKYVITFGYKNEKVNVELLKTVAPRQHENHCKVVIATAMSSLYLRPSLLDLDKAKEWLNKTHL